MEKTPEPPSIPYPTGNHLPWQSFRDNVLLPRRIRLHEPSPAIEMPSDLLLKIQTNLGDIERFNNQREEFRAQVLQNRGFGDSPIWPPNVLRPLVEDFCMRRATSPKFSREALPLRSPWDRANLVDLPTPRPALACGFTSEAFTEIEASNLPSPLTASGTLVDFSNARVSPGVAIHCPFLVFERVKGMVADAIESAKNQCALSGATCVRALQLLYSRAYESGGNEQKPIAFSCAVDNSFAIINYHWLDNEEEYNMTSLCKFDLTKDDHFNKFQAWIEGIEDWAITRLLPNIKSAAKRLASSTDTPLASPMPSLSLSVDTSPGGDDTLMKALRSTFSSIKWRYQGVGQTPIRSSIAQCGTPGATRRIRSLALSPMTPASPADVRHFQNIKLQIPVAGNKVSWVDVSPSSRRFDLSPLRASSLPSQDSPVRPGDASPCSPPLDAPFTPMNPVLVVQRRLDHAMDEIRELKQQLEHVNHELKAKRTETLLDMNMAAFEIFQMLSKRVDAIESEKIRPVQTQTSKSQSALLVLKQSLAQLVHTFGARNVFVGASTLAFASMFTIGRMMGYTTFEAPLGEWPRSRWSRPSGLASLWSSTLSRASTG